MSFQFSLAAVLRIRVVLEEKEERMLQQILSEIAQTREALVRIEAEIAESDDTRRSEVFKAVIGHNIHAFYGRLHELKQNRKNLEERLGKLEQLRLMQIAVYETARRNREMLTGMHEEQRSAYDTSLARLEQKTIDDNFNARRGRV
jgi:flagellar export protein FliJ